MMEHTATPYTPVLRSVRMPFRVLAALVCIMAAVAVAGTLFLMWRGTWVLTVGGVVMLPAMAWFIRLAFHAAVHGKTPTVNSEYWPFASRGVWTCYTFLILAYWIFKP
jgi:fatty acid desaturase